MPESKHYPFGHTHKRALSDSKIFNNGDDTVLPVLIVGAAPVGLVLSLLLTKLGCGEERSFLKSSTGAFHQQSIHGGVSQIDPEVSTTSRIMEKVLILHFPLRFNSWAVDHMQPQGAFEHFTIPFFPLSEILHFEQVVSPVFVTHFSQYRLIRLLLQFENFSFKCQS
ncbi:hypothetical protein DVH24_033779 [Malus domestica]|uniref:FAD-binding domain-containing protein n=1 Tax=Malus domestica TaxID=3750 RepID=A0A498HSW7_MALDO|nr:hypothetical protein DVH24_033779 [Malus domestica]